MNEFKKNGPVDPRSVYRNERTQKKPPWNWTHKPNVDSEIS